MSRCLLWCDNSLHLGSNHCCAAFLSSFPWCLQLRSRMRNCCARCPHSPAPFAFSGFVCCLKMMFWDLQYPRKEALFVKDLCIHVFHFCVRVGMLGTNTCVEQFCLEVCHESVTHSSRIASQRLSIAFCYPSHIRFNLFSTASVCLCALICLELHTCRSNWH